MCQLFSNRALIWSFSVGCTEVLASPEHLPQPSVPNATRLRMPERVQSLAPIPAPYARAMSVSM